MQPWANKQRPKNPELLSQKTRGHKCDITTAAHTRNTQTEQPHLEGEIRFCLRMWRLWWGRAMNQGKWSGSFWGTATHTQSRPGVVIMVSTVCQALACATTVLGPLPTSLIFHTPERWILDLAASPPNSSGLWFEAGSVTLDKAVHLSEVFCKTDMEEERQP